MYSIIGLLFCVLEGILVAKFGWIALLWSPIGFFVGLIASANIVLPILIGIPMAISHISKNEMKPRVFLALFRAPLIWIIVFFVFAWFFPSASHWVLNNETLTIGLLFGFVAILLSPFSKKGREDFRSDFNKSYGRYYIGQPNFSLNFIDPKDKNLLKQIESIIRISSNLYLHTFSNSTNVLNLKFDDSRFHCLIFCLSTTVKACEGILKSSDLLQKECLNFMAKIATDREEIHDFFKTPITSEQAEKSGTIYLNEYTENWNSYNIAIQQGDKNLATDILCSMIHSFENNEPLENSDKLRLKQLCWEVEFSLNNETMRDAFINLISSEAGRK